jgi:hypothetical protein
MNSNELTREQAIGAIGRRGYQSLKRLQVWLYHQDVDLTFRYAPSLITRSEAELFGMSSPRFALRTSFHPDSIVNVRRLVQFAENAVAANHAFQRERKEEIEKRLEKPTARQLRREVVHSGNCVADSVFPLPGWLGREGYKALSGEFGRAYGEGKRIVGTPFLQHTPLGGGLCAQAACFMLIAIQERLVNSVPGIAEITALATGGKGPLELSGMNVSRIKRLL